jgi:fatty-acyl-CoA synthase
MCPRWDLKTIVTNASGMGFDGVELRGLGGQTVLPSTSELASNAESVSQLFQEHGVELICLSTSASLASCSAQELEEQKATINEYIELASKLACPYVRISAGRVQQVDHHRAALARTAAALSSLVPDASRKNVTILVENGGDFRGSADLWYLCDAVEHPAVAACWSQFEALAIREHATRSIPRLASKLRLVHICDGVFDARGTFQEYKPLGEGNVGPARQIELLKGLVYGGYLVFECPGAGTDSGAKTYEPEVTLSEVSKFLRGCIEEEPAILTAYKGDKRPVKFASRPPRPSGS